MHNQICNESQNVQMTKSFVTIVTVFILFYTFFYNYFGAYLAGFAVGSGVFILSPLTFFLIRKQKVRLAQFLFIASCNYYIFVTNLGLSNLAFAHYYYLPAALIGLLLSNFKDRSLIIFSILIAYLCFLMQKTIGIQLVPQNWIVTPPISPEVFEYVNFTGSFSITLLFTRSFYNTITNLTQQMITQKSQHHQLLEIERAKAIHNSKLALLGEMAAGIAHEVNNPLTIISGNISLLISRTDDPYFLTKFESIQKSIHRTFRIVNGLKKFSRTTDKTTRQKTNIKNIINESIELLEHKLKQNQIHLTVECPEELLIVCDEIEIQQVIVNIISNAADAIHSQLDKWIHIVVKNNNQRIHILITDSGTGISKEIGEKIFMPFFTTKEVGQGTGLGLSICKGIIEDHQGTISLVDNAKNTTFLIQLPIISEN